MDFFESRYYKLNKLYLKLVGLWPYTGVWDRRILRSISQSLIFGIIIGEVIYLAGAWGDWDMFIETLVPMGVQLTALCKSFNAIFNENKMKELLEAMKKNWHDIDRIEETEIMKKYSEQGRRITVFYAVWMYSSAILWSCVPVLPRVLDRIMPLENGTRPKDFLLQVQYNFDRDEYFYPLLIQSYVVVTSAMVIIVAADSMYACYVEHACALFGIVGHRLENLAKNSDDSFDLNVSKQSDSNYQELRYCISKHFQAIEFAKLIESAYSISWLFQVGICMIMLSITGVQLVIKMGQYDQMIRLAQFIVAQLSHLFFNSWPGQKLVDCTTNFRDSIYAAEWYSLSLRARKLLSIVMIRALTPQKITAGKLYDMSMENFGSVVQTSVSYFTVFSSFR